MTRLAFTAVCLAVAVGGATPSKAADEWHLMTTSELGGITDQVYDVVVRDDDVGFVVTWDGVLGSNIEVFSFTFPVNGPPGPVSVAPVYVFPEAGLWDTVNPARPDLASDGTSVWASGDHGAGGGFGLIHRLPAPGGSWVSQTVNPSGSFLLGIRGLDAEPGLLGAAVFDGIGMALFRSTDDGQSWDQLGVNTVISVRSVAVYAGTIVWVTPDTGIVGRDLASGIDRLMYDSPFGGPPLGADTAATNASRGTADAKPGTYVITGQGGLYLTATSIGTGTAVRNDDPRGTQFVRVTGYGGEVWIADETGVVHHQPDPTRPLWAASQETKTGLVRIHGMWSGSDGRLLVVGEDPSGPAIAWRHRGLLPAQPAVTLGCPDTLEPNEGSVLVATPTPASGPVLSYEWSVDGFAVAEVGNTLAHTAPACPLASRTTRIEVTPVGRFERGAPVRCDITTPAVRPTVRVVTRPIRLARSDVESGGAEYPVQLELAHCNQSAMTAIRDYTSLPRTLWPNPSGVLVDDVVGTRLDNTLPIVTAHDLQGLLEPGLGVFEAQGELRILIEGAVAMTAKIPVEILAVPRVAISVRVPDRRTVSVGEVVELGVTLVGDLPANELQVEMAVAGYAWIPDAVLQFDESCRTEVVVGPSQSDPQGFAATVARLEVGCTVEFTVAARATSDANRSVTDDRVTLGTCEWGEAEDADCWLAGAAVPSCQSCGSAGGNAGWALGAVVVALLRRRRLLNPKAPK